VGFWLQKNLVAEEEVRTQKARRDAGLFACL
jgi:hypothetical protein